jgi:hypothetical protein
MTAFSYTSYNHIKEDSKTSNRYVNMTIFLPICYSNTSGKEKHADLLAAIRQISQCLEGFMRRTLDNGGKSMTYFGTADDNNHVTT